MNHVKALIIKFVMIAVVLLIILTGVFKVSFVDTLWISLVLTLVAYAMGDLMIFRKAGDARDQNKRNMIATISDIVVAFLVIWLVGDALIGNNPDIVTASIISAIVIGAGEWFFHKYLDRNVFPEKHDHTTTAAR
ncbi:YndM family protein [Planococcus sp. N028]|uniref:YndM family protein n=1 Tax=Planococcus shixiaomingii TaxID=3058393 RepID=A0ABT8N6B6_9BACL|nr:YndM family protein [Planococcus sp. N028]MDN7243434.1 YndM family protein [Planococcus sp. N028]